MSEIISIRPYHSSRAALLTSTAILAPKMATVTPIRLESAQVMPVPKPLPSPNSGQGGALVITTVADIEPKAIEWLWPQRFAVGKLSLIAGHPGLGKSQLTAYMAAVVSTGGNWPCDEGNAESGDVLMLSAEDDIEDTIRPRLEAAGADLTRIHVIEAVKSSDGSGKRGFNLAADIERLGEAIAKNGNVRLVTIDPITAYLGGIDSHRTTDVRAALAPLQALASSYGAAVIGVTHLNKSGSGGAMNRVTGSLAFVAAARAAFIVARDTEDGDRRLFVPAKNNLGNDTTGLAFHVEQRDLANGIIAPVVVWRAGKITVSADEILAADAAGQGDRSSKAEAMEFLSEMLADKPLSARDVMRMGADAGFSEKALRSAREELGIKPQKAGFGSTGAWVWELPATP